MRALALGGVCLLLLAASALAASIDGARALHQAGRVEEAKEELFDVLSSGAADADKAAALHLLGTIGTEQEDYAWALESWSRLQRDYPDSEDASRVASKVPLVEALAECKGQRRPAVYLGPPRKEEVIEPPAPAGEAAAPPPSAPAPAPKPKPAPAGEAATAPAPPAAAPTPAPKPQAAAAPAAPTAAGGTLIAGFGWPFEESQKAVEEMRAFFAEGGAETEVVESEVIAIRGADRVREAHRAQAREQGAHLIYVDSQFGFREYVRIECFGPKGDLLWKEKITGGYALSEKKVNPRLMERMRRRLERRFGGPCLEARQGR